MFGLAAEIDGSWSGSWSRSGSRSGSGSGFLPPSLELFLCHHPGEAVSGIARGMLIEGNGIWALLDAIQEYGPMMQFAEGLSYFVETFGKHYVGRVRMTSPTTVILEDASWVASSGRFNEFLKNGKADNMEIEPVGEVEIGIMYISAKYPWPHKLFAKAV